MTDEIKRPSRAGKEILNASKPQIERLQRRLFLRQGLSLGALVMLTGCDYGSLAENDGLDRLLRAMSGFNDRVQALLFNPHRLAPTYAASQITKPFPFNAFYGIDDAPDIDPDAWKLEVSGLVSDKTPWTVQRLRGLPQESQITRLICVEGWSAIGQWSGVPFRAFLERIGADTTAKYVGLKCADKYYSSIDMATALHPQTIMTLDFGGEPLPGAYGAPMRLRVPTKLGFKNPKYIQALYVTNTYPGGYWEDQGYNWFSGS
ncbi:molybdopterin-dependent oxidoreductase [Gluconobacter wancherniae]|uniref:molybdopterin-dependent oxidoreductase n=1 Tax=Gluconobacter TaxID=441 RepID=UPI001B8D28F5|nr:MULTISPECIES: molybdopterin-dependent oxidoreductase [Gluconobacter]MBS1039096.1 molybdopterin-dependent oxidoreductase [Gluconobacter cerinus]MBS1063958.1 molybdopterin-dependent oxidoreductase [Gluconobacter wancherniae]MBS1072734.1 molybdopterin-dependent oxidoreductase [Gluconobacter cerinus]MBS1089946.1 molybdopterin-dependent oxidoreductase [Gluconobacter wancherniae]MCW2267185.1 DMSO/TMAO reductase YedYZ molybdopterin-dependent catalytic subunit [Gluconobacter cerinus]